uniref:Uncharacterized protein n=1 Tax=Lygus hesperus TaxID=30085 RepID=A0A146LKV9_LYGHE
MEEAVGVQAAHSVLEHMHNTVNTLVEHIDSSDELRRTVHEMYEHLPIDEQTLQFVEHVYLRKYLEKRRKKIAEMLQNSTNHDGVWGEGERTAISPATVGTM